MLPILYSKIVDACWLKKKNTPWKSFGESWKLEAERAATYKAPGEPKVVQEVSENPDGGESP